MLDKFKIAAQKLVSQYNLTQEEIYMCQEWIGCSNLSIDSYSLNNLMVNQIKKLHTDPQVRKQWHPGYHVDLFDYKGIKFGRLVKYFETKNGIQNQFWTFTERGNLAKLILMSKRLDIKPIILPPETFNLIRQKTIKYIKQAKRNKHLPSSGLILRGKPGNGKSMILEYLKNKCSDYYKITNLNITRREISIYSSPTIHAFDDTDISFFSRSGSRSEEASYLLNFLDGESKKSHVYILTTNEDVGVIDKAFLRPGRFDTIIELKNPNAELRKKFIETWNINIDAQKLIQVSDGWSFAELGYVRTCLILQELNKENVSLDRALADFDRRKEEEKRYLGFSQGVKNQ